MPTTRAHVIGLVLWTTTLVHAHEAHAFTVKTTSTGRVVHWNTGRVRLLIEPSAVHGVGVGPLREAAAAAAESWLNVPNAPEIVVEMGDPGPVGYDPERYNESGLYVVQDWPFDHRLLAVTVATYDENSGELLDADIVVNANQHFEARMGNVDGSTGDQAALDSNGHVEAGQGAEEHLPQRGRSGENAGRDSDADAVAGSATGSDRSGAHGALGYDLIS